MEYTELSFTLWGEENPSQRVVGPMHAEIRVAHNLRFSGNVTELHVTKAATPAEVQQRDKTPEKTYDAGKGRLFTLLSFFGMATLFRGYVCWNVIILVWYVTRCFCCSVFGTLWTKLQGTHNHIPSRDRWSIIGMSMFKLPLLQLYLVSSP